MADEEPIESTPEGEGAIEEAAPTPELVPETPPEKFKSNIYTVLLILSFMAFLAVIVMAGCRLHEHYNVRFWILSGN